MLRMFFITDSTKNTFSGKIKIQILGGKNDGNAKINRQKHKRIQFIS